MTQPLATAALAAELRVDDPRLRVAVAEARAALDAVTGRSAVAARARLRFGPGRTCERLGRLLDTAIMRAERAGLDPANLVVASGTAEPGEDIVRVRRKAHGDADWIVSPTSRVRIVLRPAGLASVQAATADATAGDAAPAGTVLADTVPAGAGPGNAGAGNAGAGTPEAHAPGADAAEAGTAGVGAASVGAADVGTIGVGVAGTDYQPAAAVREALTGVIDPDLGVNVVDLGFVRDVTVREGTAVLTMTLTSAACPLTKIMEDQIRDALVPVPDVHDVRLDWQWIPAWRPSDITPDGRDQLSAIGFTF